MGRAGPKFAGPGRTGLAIFGPYRALYLTYSTITDLQFPDPVQHKHAFWTCFKGVSTKHNSINRHQRADCLSKYVLSQIYQKPQQVLGLIHSLFMLKLITTFKTSHVSNVILNNRHNSFQTIETKTRASTNHRVLSIILANHRNDGENRS